VNVRGSSRIQLLRSRSQEKTVHKAERATKAVGYTRVSTEEQASKGHGLDVQERAIRCFAESQAYHHY
jgi:site-specific DNA recombinase